MFSYCGGKSRIVARYPSPRYKLIIEPFAGSARYGLLHHESAAVLLIEKNPVVYRLWKWLQKVDAEFIQSLPTLKPRDPIPTKYGYDAAVLMGFVYNRGVASPRRHAGNFGTAANANGWDGKQLLIKRLPFIRNWQILEGDYSLAPNVEATWFIDPPYSGQTYYPVGRDLDYSQLSKWCKSRKGQVIVCENDTATWLPFKPFCAQTHTQRKSSKSRNEGIWEK